MDPSSRLPGAGVSAGRREVRIEGSRRAITVRWVADRHLAAAARWRPAMFMLADVAPMRILSRSAGGRSRHDNAGSILRASRAGATLCVREHPQDGRALVVVEAKLFSDGARRRSPGQPTYSLPPQTAVEVTYYLKASSER
jgi:hypothetical protein